MGLEMTLTAPLAAGIDIGGGSAKIGLVSSAGTMVEQFQVKIPPSQNGTEILLAFLSQLKAKLAAHTEGRLSGLGIGVPGYVDQDHTTTFKSNVPAIDDLDIRGLAETELDCPVFIENDAIFAAVGEQALGSGKGVSRFLMITLGTGLGTGFVEDGVPILTGNGAMGDAGHLIVDPSLEHGCRQGCFGCVESVASGEALNRRIEEVLAADRTGHLPDIVSSGSRPTVRDLIAGVRAGDPACVRIMDETSHWLAMWITGLTHMFAPQMVAFGGGWSAAGQGYVDEIATKSRHMGLPYYFEDLQFVQAELGNSAGIMGAAITALRQTKEMENGTVLSG